DGDTIRAGKTVLTVRLEPDPADESAHDPDLPATLDFAAADPTGLPVVPGHRLMRELGRGGMGVVYLAVREADGAEVAVKTVAPAGTVTRRNIDRFLREASILKRLDHPNVVRFREIGAANGLLFFTMDYIRGTDAGRVLAARGPWSVRSAVRTAREVLKALAFAHGSGFVHRDVKPSNILLRTGPRGAAVKLADFGLAR